MPSSAQKLLALGSAAGGDARLSPLPQEAEEDLSREVYGVFGIPVDATDLAAVTQQIQRAAKHRRAFLLSTPNTNFLIQSATRGLLRESLLKSNLCIADGMPIVVLGRMLGVPIRKRLAGADLFEALKLNVGGPPLKVFFFGGAPGVVERACKSPDGTATGIVCVGWHDPGFGDVEAISSDEIIDRINGSGADFLSVSLGAQKGQGWLLRNHDRLSIPIRVHLGATINFQSGQVKRSPAVLGNAGLEWLWRIKEEPYLWRRYWADGCKLIWLLLARALPLLAHKGMERLRPVEQELEMTVRREGALLVLGLSGSATRRNVAHAILSIRAAIAMRMPLAVDLSNVKSIDSRFIGLLLMLRKQANECGGMRLVNVPSRIRRILWLNGFAFLVHQG